MLRAVRQPGAAAAERCVFVAVGCVPIVGVLPAGPRLLDALHGLLVGGVESACLRLSGGGFGPFGYVIPAVSTDGEHAAFYSSVFRPEGVTRLDAAAVTVGWRDGRAWFHCHGVWTEADGRRGCGHVLPEETVIASPVSVDGSGIVGGRFVVRADAETGFSLFVPEASGAAWPAGGRRGVALRLAPNQEIGVALAEVSRRTGFARATVRGGVGSIIGAKFVSAAAIDGFATELLVRDGVLRPEPALDVVIVDLEGRIGEGRLVAGENAVLMTFEAVLEEV